MQGAVWLFTFCSEALIHSHSLLWPASPDQHTCQVLLQQHRQGAFCSHTADSLGGCPRLQCTCRAGIADSICGKHTHHKQAASIPSSRPELNQASACSLPCSCCKAKTRQLQSQAQPPVVCACAAICAQHLANVPWSQRSVLCASHSSCGRFRQQTSTVISNGRLTSPHMQ